MPRRHRYQHQPFPIRVTEDTLASKAGIQSGDILLAINGEPVGDFLHFYEQVSDELLDMQLLRQGKSPYEVQIVRSYGEPLGLMPNPEPLKDVVECENKCVFCFIHQQPKGLRRTLFIRDDDYRYSFSHGNFITLTNLTQADWQRIYRDRLSPLNISIHAMRPSLREEMIKHPRARRIKKQLRSLAAHGIAYHTQIVLCPDLNDRDELEHTISQLLAFVPNLLSICVVPVGLTRFRSHLPGLRPMSGEELNDTIARVEKWQQYCLNKYGDPIVRLADEIYWLAGREFPAWEHYGEFSQVEDGVGIVRRFIDTFQRGLTKLPKALPHPYQITIMTGQIAADILSPLIKQVNQQIEGLQINVLACHSPFWGERITVAGLLRGDDLLQNAAGCPLGDEVWIPEIMIRNDKRCFLDDMSFHEFEQKLGYPVRAIPEYGDDLLNAIRLIPSRIQSGLRLPG